MRIRGGWLRRLVLVMSLGVVGALAVAGATSAQVEVESDSSGSTVTVLGGKPEFVTFCHIAGREDDPANTITLTLPYNAVFGQAGHFNEDGTPQAGHEHDYLGECREEPPPPPADVCPNIEGNQAEIPGGMVKDEQGNCVTPPPPADVCPNIEGNQSTIPEGMIKDANGNCVQPPAGISVTAGVTFTEATCTTGPSFNLAKTNPGLRFYNVEGPDFVNGKPVPGGTYTFTALPDEGYMVVGQSVWLHTFAAAPTDCGVPPPPPPTVVSDEFMDVQVVKDATAQVQLVNGQADIAYTVRVRNNGPNQAHNVVLTDAAPGGVTFLAVTTQPVGGNCTVSAALLSCTLGTIGPGVERTIGLSARVTQTGTYVNSATGIGDGKDTNAANNTDDASTLVTAPVTPPTTKPATKPTPKSTPKPKLEVCRILKVTPGMVKVNGKQQLVLATVTQSKNPVAGVAVRFAGTGFVKVVKTNAHGVARLEIKPSKAGIMLVRITSAKACNSARIGVIGAFEPPVTG